MYVNKCKYKQKDQLLITPMFLFLHEGAVTYTVSEEMLSAALSSSLLMPFVI